MHRWVRIQLLRTQRSAWRRLRVLHLWKPAGFRRYLRSRGHVCRDSSQHWFGHTCLRNQLDHTRGRNWGRRSGGCLQRTLEPSRPRGIGSAATFVQDATVRAACSDGCPERIAFANRTGRTIDHCIRSVPRGFEKRAILTSENRFAPLIYSPTNVVHDAIMSNGGIGFAG